MGPLPCRSGEEESIPSFVTRIEGLLSQIRDRFPDELPLPEEQRFLKDCLFHGCKKSIWDSVKYCFADPQIEYMHFLEECRKAEDEDKVENKPRQEQQKPKWQQPQYCPPGKMSWLSDSSTSSSKLISWWSRLKLGLSFQNHKGLLQRGHGRWLWEATSKHMERRF